MFRFSICLVGTTQVTEFADKGVVMSSRGLAPPQLTARVGRERPTPKGGSYLTHVNVRVDLGGVTVTEPSAEEIRARPTAWRIWPQTAP